MTTAHSAALVIRLNDLSAPARDLLVALLADYQLIAIQEDDPTTPSVWTAHFANADARDAAAGAIRRDAGLAGAGIEPIEVDDEDWARRTQADLPAVQVGNVIIAPPWDLPDSQQRLAHARVVVVIEPSRGFGTGHHQSTRLCLALLQNRNLAGLTMIDVGTGSGVLAITAAKLGAAYVAAVDADPDAIENARENIATNGVDDIVEAHVEDFTTAKRTPADLVTANLTSALLVGHHADLARLLRPAGQLIVSGFNLHERPMVEDAFAPLLSVMESAEEEGWQALVFGR